MIKPDETFPGFPPISLLCPLGHHYYPLIPITQSIMPENYRSSKSRLIHNLKMNTKKMQGVPPLSYLCTLGWHYYPVTPINKSTPPPPFCLSIGTRLGVVGWSFSSFLFSGFLNNYSVLTKINLISQNHGILHNFDIGFLKLTLANMGLPEAWLEL